MAALSAVLSPPAKRLSAAQRSAFASDGFLAPLNVLSPDEVAGCRGRLDEALARSGGRPDVRLRNNPHLLLRWMADLVRDARLLDAVEDLLGPDLLVLRTTLFIKTAGDASEIAWHQDLAYWDLSEDRAITAWVALTDSTAANGCVWVVRASHRAGLVDHQLARDPQNRLLRGQLANVEVAPEQVVPLELRAGEMSLHDGLLLHSSRCNPSATLRAGLAIRFIRPETRAGGPRGGVTLVRGADPFGHYDHEPAPRYDYDPIARAWHRRALRRYALHVAWQIARSPSRANLALLARFATRPDLLRAMR